MKPTLVTGASGFVGWHLARALAGAGHRVRALVRENPVPGLDVELAHGDLRDPEACRLASEGCGLVFHVAADYRLWSPRPEELYRSNVDGTRNLCAAAVRAGVERVVYTSTVGTIGVRNGLIASETSPVSLKAMTGHYKRSKYLAEQVALEFAAQGLDLVVVNPTTPVGDRDVKPTPTGRIVVDFLAGRMPAFVDTGLNLVDVEDVARGHLLAAVRGRRSERYILGSENLTLQQILARLAALSGRRAPTVRIPHAVAYVAGAFSTLAAHLTGRPPDVPLEGVRMARTKAWVSHAKAAGELGYAPGPVDGALSRAVGWFTEAARREAAA
ncbi:MAG: NAD-dependent epimerase/dehydratase family protein [Acidobacteria bacterium]|nr:NAD-dependent epimerase/dehydratase family protein [Acidobacteriota bacterium]